MILEILLTIHLAGQMPVDVDVATRECSAEAPKVVGRILGIKTTPENDTDARRLYYQLKLATSNGAITYTCTWDSERFLEWGDQVNKRRL